jgi:hypothetical protein
MAAHQREGVVLEKHAAGLGDSAVQKEAYGIANGSCHRAALAAHGRPALQASHGIFNDVLAHLHPLPYGSHSANIKPLYGNGRAPARLSM